jgi:hypothetical protein
VVLYLLVLPYLLYRPYSSTTKFLILIVAPDQKFPLVNPVQTRYQAAPEVRFLAENSMAV